MDKLFRWTIYLMILFIMAIVLYLYSWWSFTPQKRKDLVANYENYIVDKL